MYYITYLHQYTTASQNYSYLLRWFLTYNYSFVTELTDIMAWEQRKEKIPERPIFRRELCPGTIIKNMVIILKCKVEYKENEDIFNQQ